MCGLTGYFNFNRPLEGTTKPIVEMLSMLRHRGPDDSGIVAINTRDKDLQVINNEAIEPLAKPADLVFGFNRLSIMDLSQNGHQPMLGADGQVVLMMNGEIYNAFDLRPELEQKGFIFRSNTDTEVVLNLYLAYGFAEMIHRLNGMFAITIYDQRFQKLFLARDRFGIKPLYVLQHEGRIAFSSEMKCFKALPAFRFALNEEHLDEFLLFRNLINRTLFKDIANLTPGSYWEIALDGTIQKHTYHDLWSVDNTTLSVDKAMQVLDESLAKSVHSQLMSDVKLGCQLSGGVDSSLVTHYAAEKVTQGQLETISIIFDQPSFSEETYVDEVAQKLQLKAHKFTLDAGYYMEHLDRATWHFEQPLNHPNTIGIYLLSEEARKYVTVLLSGEGADETFAGYSRFKYAVKNYWTSRDFLSKLKQNRSQVIPFLKLALNRDDQMLMGGVVGALGTSMSLRSGFQLDRALQHRRDIAKKLEGSSLTRYRKYELLTYLPDLLMRQDKMSMAHSIENRVPFLDNELVKQALRFPSASLLQNRNGSIATKYALKQLCANKFDTSFAFRPKMGFGIPLKAFMGTPFFTEKLNDQILPKMSTRGVFEVNALKSLGSNIQNATPAQLEGLWLMTGFESWAQQYLDG